MNTKPSRKLCELPNGMKIAYQCKSEVGFFYDDIFLKKSYMKNGITLEEGDVVFDVGSNVGLFSLFVHRLGKRISIYAFEPVPRLYQIAKFNFEHHSVNAQLFNIGLSDRAKNTAFTFYPNSSGLSSCYANLDEEGAVLRSIMQHQLAAGDEGMGDIMPHVDAVVAYRLQGEGLICEMQTLSEVVGRLQLKRIDLLKIDVQKSEWDVLMGIKEEDWSIIRQLVIEVHDVEGRLETIIMHLKRKRFHVIVQQDDPYNDSIMYNVYAIKME